MHTRLKILCWQILRNALPTRAKLGQFMAIPSVCCPLCNDEEETSIHLFWQCSFAKAIWYGSLWGIRTDSIQFPDWMDWFQWFNCKRNLPHDLDFDTFLIGALCIIEVVWNNRNKVIHGSNITPINEVIRIMRRQFHDHSSSRQPLSKNVEISATPPMGWIACTTDVSINADQSFGAVVFRDSCNRIQAIYSVHLNVTNPTLVEALMIVSAAEFGVRCKFNNVLFFCDNLLVVTHFNALHGEDHQLLNGAVERFFTIVRPLENWKVKKISRGANFMAHNSAKWARYHGSVGELVVNTMDEGVLLDDTEWVPDPG
ncbi:uncharacterized protein LOC115696608 [Cannabis sativa]|uniref:RNase H type-1 domain-containing protein n=1 Tax=Cannabis sativa TaxID=3483 RepID=A0A803QD48_CANSA|nr:uncharacterized protein LOC115696608 [Cannabis sativa]